MVFNGDVLSGLDLRALLDTHETTAPTSRCTWSGRRSARVRLRADRPRRRGEGVPGEDPGSADRPDQCGLLRLQARGHRRIPGPGGVGRARGVPGLLADGCGCAATSTPPTGATWARPRTSSAALPTWCAVSRPRRRWAVSAATLVHHGAAVAPGALLIGGTVIGRGAEIGAGVGLDGAVVFDGARIEAGAVIERSIIGFGAGIGRGADPRRGDRRRRRDRRALRTPGGARVWPGVTIPDGGIRFSTESWTALSRVASARRRQRRTSARRRSSPGSSSTGHQRRSNDSALMAISASAGACTTNCMSRCRVGTPSEQVTGWTCRAARVGSILRPAMPDSSVASRSAAATMSASVASQCPPSWTHRPTRGCSVSSASLPVWSTTSAER